MILTEKHIITKNNTFYQEVDHLCFLSKNLYNVGLYSIRQHFFQAKNFLDYEDLQKQLQKSQQIDYYALPAKISQQILKILCRNFKSFFNAVQEYKKHPEKFKAPPKLPKYKHKTKGRNIVPYPIDAINTPLLKKNKVKLSMTNISISSTQKNIKQVRMIPRKNNHKIEIVYEKSPFLFTLEDIGKSFVARLKGNDPISLYLKEKLATNLQKQINNVDISKKLSTNVQKAIVNKLNSLLKVSLYDKEKFKDVTFSKQTQELLKQNPGSEKLIHLNRLLLEEAYPTEIKKNKKQKTKQFKQK